MPITRSERDNDCVLMVTPLECVHTVIVKHTACAIALPLLCFTPCVDVASPYVCQHVCHW